MERSYLWPCVGALGLPFLGSIVAVVSGLRWVAISSALLAFLLFLFFCMQSLIEAQELNVKVDDKVVRRAVGMIGTLFAICLGVQSWVVSGMS
jgi:hypothetical protein